ncbi:MAG TPA: hypothetical protein PKB01_00580 [Xanthobacteraceae bacterium]|nr:hypothetical protein [Xanthobacteraceae bacterium]
MDWFAPLFAGLGLGTLITTIVSNLMSRRANLNDRTYQEKREAYLGLLKAIHEAATKPSDETAKAYALWQTRCNLFGSASVSKYAQDFVDTNDGPRELRAAAFNNLVIAMKADLLR